MFDYAKDNIVYFRSRKERSIPHLHPYSFLISSIVNSSFSRFVRTHSMVFSVTGNRRTRKRSVEKGFVIESRKSQEVLLVRQW